MTEPTDRALVERALRLLPANNYEAARALRVAESTIRNWRRAPPVSLRADTHRAVVAFLRRAEGGEGAELPAASRGEPLSELARRLDAIEAQDIDERAKRLKIREVAAAYRARALADLAAALRGEAELVRVRERFELEGDRGGELGLDELTLALLQEAASGHPVSPEMFEGSAARSGRKRRAPSRAEPR